MHVQDLPGPSSAGPSAGKPHALTAADSQQRFADYILDDGGGGGGVSSSSPSAGRSPRLIAVCEDHSVKGKEATNSIAAIGELLVGALGAGERSLLAVLLVVLESVSGWFDGLVCDTLVCL